MIPIDLLPAARVDYDESFDRYARRIAAAARHFSRAIDESPRLISESPETFTAVDPLHRACLIKQFPYSIIYRIERGRIVVAAIAHAKRRPDYWR